MMRPHYGDYDRDYARGRGREMDIFDPFGFTGDMQDFDRQFRHMNRDFNRLERQLSRGSGTNLGSLVDRSYPVMPHFVEENGRKLARFHFDVGGFKPEDVSIKTADNKVIITAKHEDKGEDHHAIREFRRMVQIPQGMQFEQMKSRLTPNGVLTIEAPFNPPAIQQNQHHEIPITHETRK
ncbi:heat shock protein 30D-like [Paramacrobiotus metropolitanus]|uniref:heat shock protein 30D-like n=1 Tax=Paramacrobiotus metropolitanus TaxID=2943436 RepID=UPI002445BAE3|nr:heat shock protein 30D-like [Paramacrobiotus metropolitanus]